CHRLIPLLNGRGAGQHGRESFGTGDLDLAGALVHLQAWVCLLQVLDQSVGSIVDRSGVHVLCARQDYAVGDCILSDSRRRSDRGRVLPSRSLPVRGIGNAEIGSLQSLEVAAGLDLLVADSGKSSVAGRGGCRAAHRLDIARDGTSLLILRRPLSTLRAG